MRTEGIVEENERIGFIIFDADALYVVAEGDRVSGLDKHPRVTKLRSWSATLSVLSDGMASVYLIGQSNFGASYIFPRISAVVPVFDMTATSITRDYIYRRAADLPSLQKQP